MNGRLFTVDEANALLPTIIPLVERVLEARQRLGAAASDLEKVMRQASGNGGSREASQAALDMAVIVESIEKIEALGCQVKDFESGLIDFPAERNGRTVLLCWKYGEERVEWWHDMDAGFAGRQLL